MVRVTMRSRNRSLMATALVMAFALLAILPFSGQVAAQDATPEATPEPTGLAALGLQEIAVTAEDTVFTVSYVTQPFVLEGWTLFDLINQTESLSTVSLARLPEDVNAGDLSSAVFSAFQGEGGELPEWWADATFGGGAYAAAGETGHSAVYLTPGKWALFSTNPAATQSIQTITVLTAQEALDNYGVESEATPVPEAGATPVVEGLESTSQVSIEDGAFEPGDDPVAGDNVWEVTNNSEQVADLVVVRVDGDLDEEGAVTLGENFAAGDLPDDATLVGGVAGLSPGQVGYVQATLEGGTYAVFSTQPDADGGIQASNGLAAVITVE